MSNHRTLLQDMKRGINCRLEAIAAIVSLEAHIEALEKDFAYHAELCTSQQARIEALEGSGDA